MVEAVTSVGGIVNSAPRVLIRSSGQYRLNEDQIAERGARMARRDD
jgi:hypothetical protein